MKQKSLYMLIILLLIIGLFLLFANAQDSNSSLFEIIHNVQKTIHPLNEYIANFITTEEINIEEYDKNGIVTKKKSIVSEYRVVPNVLPSLQSSDITKDIRDILLIKENDVEKNSTKFIEPVMAKGNPYNDLLLWFSKDTEKCFNYKLTGTEKINARDAYVIQITTKKNAKDLGGICRFVSERNSGLAFIDRETMNIVMSQGRMGKMRVGLTPFDLLLREPYSFASKYEYGNVEINNKTWWLAVTKQSKTLRRNGHPVIIYNYNYSNYKRFDVSTNVNYETANE